MKKLREICLSEYFLIAAQILLSVAIAAGAIFYPHANVIVYRLWKIVLIDIAFVLCCGGLIALTYLTKHPDAKGLYLIFSFLIGAAAFSLLFFGGQTILDSFVNRTVSCVVGISIALAFDLGCIAMQDYLIIKRDGKYFITATGVFALGVYVATILLSFMTLPHGWVFKSFSKEAQTFERAGYEEFVITAADKQAGKKWMSSALMGDTRDAAFDFSVGGADFRTDSADWTVCVEKEETAENGDIEYIKTYTSPAGLVVRLIANYYNQTATVEWTVYLENRGTTNTPVITDLYAMDDTLAIASPILYFSGGSNEANDDFALYSRELKKSGYTFDTVNGRSSKLYLPFFNLSAADCGATIGIGWSGEWTATFSAEESTSVRIGQSALSGYLAPGESIRTPMISLCLYGGNNPLKGFNNFRADIKRGLPEGSGEANMLLFAGAEGQDDTSRANAAGTEGYIERLSTLGVLDDLDYAWYDAAWYDTSGTGDWRQSVGDWTVDAVKYPNGLGTVSDYLEEKGVKMLLWYEPERVPKSSELYRKTTAAGRTSWIIEPTNDSSDCLWNMGDADALAYMIDYIASSLEENGVAYYRQDFNIDPKTYWERADRELEDGRTGFAENKYVTGEYAFLDALRARIPGLLIDNCASGGRRIDLEMCRRAIPLWRSDYQCKKEKPDLAEAAQYQTYGLGMWLPYSCITDPNASDEYALRSLLGASVMCYADILYDAPDAYVDFIRDYRAVGGYYAMNYYPLTSCTPRSGCVAMQFGDEKSGVVVIYSREGNEGKETIVMNGLSKKKDYVLRALGGGSVIRSAGKNLMSKGFQIDALESTAYILLYNEG